MNHFKKIAGVLETHSLDSCLGREQVDPQSL